MNHITPCSKVEWTLPTSPTGFAASNFGLEIGLGWMYGNDDLKSPHIKLNILGGTSSFTFYAPELSDSSTACTHGPWSQFDVQPGDSWSIELIRSPLSGSQPYPYVRFAYSTADGVERVYSTCYEWSFYQATESYNPSAYNGFQSPVGYNAYMRAPVAYGSNVLPIPRVYADATFDGVNTFDGSIGNGRGNWYISDGIVFDGYDTNNNNYGIYYQTKAYNSYTNYPGAATGYDYNLAQRGIVSANGVYYFRVPYTPPGYDSNGNNVARTRHTYCWTPSPASAEGGSCTWGLWMSIHHHTDQSGTNTPRIDINWKSDYDTFSSDYSSYVTSSGVTVYPSNYMVDDNGTPRTFDIVATHDRSSTTGAYSIVVKFIDYNGVNYESSVYRLPHTPVRRGNRIGFRMDPCTLLPVLLESTTAGRYQTALAHV